MLPAAAAVSPFKTFSFPEPSLTPSSLPSNKYLLQSCEEERRRDAGGKDAMSRHDAFSLTLKAEGHATAARLEDRHGACKLASEHSINSPLFPLAAPCHSNDSQLTAIHHLCNSVCLSRNLLQSHPCFPTAGGLICLWSFELHSKQAVHSNVHRSPHHRKKKTKQMKKTTTQPPKSCFAPHRDGQMLLG